MPIGKIEPRRALETHMYATAMSWWYNALRCYPRRSVTKNEDTLTAIAEVAIDTQKRTCSNYIN